MQTPALLTTGGRPGAHSTAQPATALQDDSGCPTCEPLPDTAFASAASSTTAPPACARSPLSRPRGASCGPGVDTPAPTPHLLSPRWPRLAPGETVKNCCPVW